MLVLEYDSLVADVFQDFGQTFFGSRVAAGRITVGGYCVATSPASVFANASTSFTEMEPNRVIPFSLSIPARSIIIRR